jgi:Domain of unknown function (DUF4338)
MKLGGRCGMTTTALALPSDSSTQVVPCDLSALDSENLGIIVRDGVIGVATKLAELKPYVEELWKRLDRGQVILGCSTKNEFCEQVLQRTPRAVRYMLQGGNPNNKKGEIISPQQFIHQNHVPSSNPPEFEPPKDFEDLYLEPCSSSDPRYQDIREDHYVENNGCIGQQAHFLIRYKGEIAGIISGASPVYTSAGRDEFFGIDKTNRNKFLQGIVNNTVFRLENHTPHLATQILALWRKVVPHFWYEKYGVVVFGFETFVVANGHRTGSLYKGDNWTEVRTSEAATKMRNAIESPANWVMAEPKLVFCKWRDGFSHPVASKTPEWVRTSYPVQTSTDSCEWKRRSYVERFGKKTAA